MADVDVRPSPPPSLSTVHSDDVVYRLPDDRADAAHTAWPVTTSSPTPSRVREVGQLLRGMIAGAMLAVLVALGFDNTQDVSANYVFGDGTAPLWALLAVAAAAGVVVGWLVALRSHRAR